MERNKLVIPKKWQASRVILPSILILLAFKYYKSV